MQTPRLLIRISDNNIAFASPVKTEDAPVWYSPYEGNKGISVAANLREAFRTADSTMRRYDRVVLIVDGPLLLIPIEEFDQQGLAEQFAHVYPNAKGEMLVHHTLPGLKAVAVTSMQKDILTVLEDNFSDVRVQPLMSKVWEYFAERSQGGNAQRVFAYFHERKMQVCSFMRNRFYFVNTFDVTDGHDALYFLLGVWKQLNYNSSRDELYICGSVVDGEWLCSETRQFLPRTYTINPAADFNKAPVTEMSQLPFDLMLEFV